MSIVRLSGTVTGRRDANRKTRAKLLYRLYDAGWNIYNGNGDQAVNLANIQDKIIESNAFVYTPGATLEDMFNAASTSVGIVTNDRDLKGKKVAIFNADYSWDCFIDLLEHLQEMGTISYHHDVYFKIVYRPKDVVKIIEGSYHLERKEYDELQKEDDILKAKYTAFEDRHTTRPKFNVCVFCSASITKKSYLDAGYQLGKDLAKNGWGCVSGAGRTGIMGAVVEGTYENGGWAGGSNIPHIIAMEGQVPDGISEFWPRFDIYTRMEVMLEKSDCFVIMPGGIGTVQELLALIILKEQHNPLMKHKNIIVVNQDFGEGKKFWSPMIKLLNSYGAYDMFHVVGDCADIIPKIKSLNGL